MVVGMVILACARGEAASHYVSASNPKPVSPYTSWETAAKSIQQALDVAVAGDAVVVTNGVYQTGGRTPGSSLLTRVVVGAGVAVRSVNGPEVTLIRGAKAAGGGNGNGAVRCVFLDTDASLSGFTLTNGATALGLGPFDSYGGGVYGASSTAMVSNCVLVANSAEVGGGAYSASLRNCKILGNTASSAGGGAAYSSLASTAIAGNSADIGGGVAGFASQPLLNCSITGNSARSGGGIASGALTNCIVYANRAVEGDDNYSADVVFAFSCTTPLPQGEGNIESDPRLTDWSHVAVESPCRSVGSPIFPTDTDIDGEAWRVPPSIGCDEVSARTAGGPLVVRLQASYRGLLTSLPSKVGPSLVTSPPQDGWEGLLTSSPTTGGPESPHVAFTGRREMEGHCAEGDCGIL